MYLFGGILLYFFQRNIMYRPDNIKPSLLRANVDMESIELQVNENLSLMSWYKAPEPTKPMLVYFHGNAGDIESRVPNLRSFLDSGYGLFLLSYRGYGKNPGKPTEQGLYDDARAAMDYVIGQQIPLSKIFIFGESLGTGVAMQMALEYETIGLILQSPYTSLYDIASDQYPIYPTKLLVKDGYDSLSKIDNISQKLLIIHGQLDSVVPIRMGKQLYEKALVKKEIFISKTADHGDILSADMANRVRGFIQDTLNTR